MEVGRRRGVVGVRVGVRWMGKLTGVYAQRYHYMDFVFPVKIPLILIHYDGLTFYVFRFASAVENFFLKHFFSWGISMSFKTRNGKDKIYLCIHSAKILKV